MKRISGKGLNAQILKQIQGLPDTQKVEILKFIEFLQLQEDHTFLAYVNYRTAQAIEAKRNGERFLSLKEFQEEYAASTVSS